MTTLKITQFQDLPDDPFRSAANKRAAAYGERSGAKSDLMFNKYSTGGGNIRFLTNNIDARIKSKEETIEVKPRFSWLGTKKETKLSQFLTIVTSDGTELAPITIGPGVNISFSKQRDLRIKPLQGMNLEKDLENKAAADATYATITNLIRGIPGIKIQEDPASSTSTDPSTTAVDLDRLHDASQ